MSLEVRAKINNVLLQNPRQIYRNVSEIVARDHGFTVSTKSIGKIWTKFKNTGSLATASYERNMMVTDEIKSYIADSYQKDDELTSKDLQWMIEKKCVCFSA